MTRPMGLRSAAERLDTPPDEPADRSTVAEVHHRQNLWIPWTVVGAGVVIAAASLPLYLLAREDFDDHRNRFDELCIDEKKPEGGCIPTELSGDELKTWNSLEDLKGRATAEYNASIALLSAGAAVTAAGIALVVLNLPRVVEQPEVMPSLTVTASPGALGLSVRF